MWNDYLPWFDPLPGPELWLGWRFCCLPMARPWHLATHSSLSFMASSLMETILTLRMELSLSRWLALMASSSSLCFLASLDFFAASLFLRLLSKYLSSFCSSGMGFFSPRGLLFLSALRAFKALARTGLDRPGTNGCFFYYYFWCLCRVNC